MSENRESPPSMQKMSIAGPLGGDAGDPRPPTINAKKHRRWPPWEAVLETSERPPSMQKRSMVAPLGGTVGDLGAPNINAKNIDGGPLGGGARDSGVPTINT
jgi:hypothetical protein